MPYLFLRTTCCRTAFRLAALGLVLALLGACATTPKPTSRVRADSSPVVRDALSLMGAPYRWGRESPAEGFDCSGFVQYVYRRQGIRLPRTAYEMALALPRVDSRYRQPGDLVFFNTTGRPFSHVGIYVGNNAFVHSSSVRGRVIVSDLDGQYWWAHFLGVRRPQH